MVEPVYFPDEPDPGAVQFETAPPTSRMEGLGISIEDAWLKGIDHNLYLGVEKSLLDNFHPGKFLTSDEYEGSDLKVPGKTFPFGVSESVAKLTQKQFLGNSERETLLQNMTPGFLSGSTKFVGQGIGTVFSPTTLITSPLAPEIAGVKSASLIAKLGEASTPMYYAGRAALGGVEGALATAPVALSEFDYNLDINDDPQILSMLATIGFGAGFGAGVRGIFGWHQTITEDADKVARQTAINQLISGKSVNLDEILKNGRYQSAKRGRPVIPIELQNQASSDLENIISGVKDNIKEIGETVDNNHGATLLNKTLQILKKSPIERTFKENLTLEGIPRNKVFEDILQAATEDPLNRSDDQKLLLDQLFDGDEKTLNELESLRLRDEIKKDPDNRSLLTELQDLLSRVNELKEFNKTTSSADRDKILKLEREKFRLRELEELKSSNDLVSELQGDSKPVTLDEVKSSSSKIHSVGGDSFVHTDKSVNLDQAIDPDLTQQLEELRSRASELRDANKLPPEILETFDDIEKDTKNLNTFKSALDNLVSCLVGGVA